MKILLQNKIFIIIFFFLAGFTLGINTSRQIRRIFLFRAHNSKARLLTEKMKKELKLNAVQTACAEKSFTQAETEIQNKKNSLHPYIIQIMNQAFTDFSACLDNGQKIKLAVMRESFKAEREKEQKKNNQCNR